MNNIQLLGQQTIGGKQFNGIAGGFGKDKRAMLAKDIASIHGKALYHINEDINKNRKRFIDGEDIIDLKSIVQTDRDLLNQLGLSNSSIANSLSIYLLSERGYSKLLKILEDDKAWEMYDLLVSDYFQMKAMPPKQIVLNEPQRLRAESMLMNAKTRQAKILKDTALDFQERLSDESVHLLLGGITEILMGKTLLPMPVVEKTYSATEIGSEIGVSANKIGKTANANNLKTDQYGIYVLNKSPHSTQQVSVFRYNERGRERLKELLAGVCQQ